MNAYGASHRAAAALLPSASLPWSGVGSSRSLPCLLPAPALPDGACPPVGRWGLTSPPAPVLCAATTATLPLSGRFACRSLPDPVPASLGCGGPKGRVVRSQCPDRARALGHPGPHSGPGLQETGGAPTFPRAPSEDMPRSPTPVVSCARAKVHPGRRPSSHWKPSATHHVPHGGAPSRGLSPRSTRLRMAPDGEARGVAPDLRARLSSGRTCTRRCAPTGEQQPIAWTCVHSQGFGLTLARPVPGSAWLLNSVSPIPWLSM
jgi:hypothetical protein